MKLNHRHLRIIDCLTARTACLVCFICTVNGHSKKKKEEKKAIMGCASSGHITKLKQSTFAFRYLWTKLFKSKTCDLYYIHITIVNYNSSIANKLGASLTGDARVIIYNHMFKIQATGFSHKLTYFSGPKFKCQYNSTTINGSGTDTASSTK